MKIESPVMRYHGGKYRLADWIISFFPPHTTYVEPFGGAGSVLMQKPKSFSEVYNDLHSEIVTLFKVLRDPELCKLLTWAVIMTPYSRDEFLQSYKPTDDLVETARRVLIRAAMGFGSAGTTKNRTGFRINTARVYETSAMTWAKYPENIASFCQRLQGVIIENRDALWVIDNHDRPDTLFYVDPPYMPETRHRGRTYVHDLDDDRHVELLEKLLNLEGMVVLSGYECPLYEQMLGGWESHKKHSRVASFRGTRIGIETLWLNPACAAQKPQTAMFC